MIIFGAGLAGCVAGIINPTSTIYEANPTAITNHKAVLRFRSNAISKATGVPFRKVKVYKAAWGNDRFTSLNPRVMNAYSNKVLGKVVPRSITNLDTVTRYIAPSNFHEQLQAQLRPKISYGYAIKEVTDVSVLFHNGRVVYRKDIPAISTLPMPTIAKVTGTPIAEKDAEFSFRSIYTTQYELPDYDVFQTIYYPYTDTNIYRASITGNNLIIESVKKLEAIDLDVLKHSFGITGLYRLKPVSSGKQKYGKISEIDNSFRRAYLYNLTRRFNIYSLGRFATWRNILLDDVLDDAYKIHQFLTSDHYQHFSNCLSSED